MGLLIITKDIDHEGVNAEPWIKYLQIHVNLASFSNSWFLIFVGPVSYKLFGILFSQWQNLIDFIYTATYEYLIGWCTICRFAYSTFGECKYCICRDAGYYILIFCWLQIWKQSLYSSYLGLLFDILDGNCVALVEHNDPENSIVATMNYTHHDRNGNCD